MHFQVLPAGLFLVCSFVFVEPASLETKVAGEANKTDVAQLNDQFLRPEPVDPIIVQQPVDSDFGTDSENVDLKTLVDRETLRRELAAAYESQVATKDLEHMGWLANVLQRLNDLSGEPDPYPEFVRLYDAGALDDLKLNHEGEEDSRSVGDSDTILPARERRYRRILPNMNHRNLYRPRYYRYFRRSHN